jgi:hypothetical protein
MTLATTGWHCRAGGLRQRPLFRYKEDGSPRG